MNSEIAPDPPFNCCSQPRQLSLFPLDKWGAEYVFEVVAHAARGISRAMVGPLLLGNSYKPRKIKCLCTTEDGVFTAAIWIDQPTLENPKIFWEMVEKELVIARQRPISHNSVDLSLNSDDCVKKWMKPELWDAASACSETIPRCVHALSKLLRFQEFGKDIFVDDEPLKRIEVKALAMLREQLSSAVHWVIGGLKSELGSILINRPGLSMALANQIVSRAQQVGSTPVVYALQALRTESIGVLHLIATGQPEHDARRVQEAIFSGQSLPDTFAELGVAKSTHRLTVLRPAHSGAVALVPAVSLNDLSITGRDWLNAMRLTKHLPLQRGKDLSDFGRLLNQLLVINFQRSETAPRLLQWSIRFGYARSNVRLERLVLHSQKLVRACNSLTGKNITIDDAITALLDWLQNMPKDGNARDNFHHAPDSDNHNAVLAGVALVLRQPIGKLTQSIFDAHPMLPKNFITPKGLILHALDSLDLATSHGKALNNCLRFPSTVVNYVMQGLALYGVHTKAGVIGTIALKYDKTEKDPQVEVQEVAGINNAPAELALCELAQRLAASWTTAEQEANWTEYEDQCTQWRHLLSSVAQ